MFDKLIIPNNEYRPHIMWFWNGILDRDEIRRQLQGFKDNGILNFFVHPMFALPVDYLGQDFFSGILEIVTAAKELGLNYWIYDDYNWPSGMAGGKLIRDYPEYRGRLLFHKTIFLNNDIPEIQGTIIAVFLGNSNSYKLVEGISEDNIETLIRDSAINSKYDEAIIFYEDFEHDKLPCYDWTPFCWGETGHTDTANPDALAKFIEITHEQYKKILKEEFGLTVKGIFTDELSFTHSGMEHTTGHLENSPTPWTVNMLTRFQSKYNYDLRSRLVDLFHKTPTSTKTRYDYRRFLSDELANGAYRQPAEWCKKNNLLFTGHLNGEEVLLRNLWFFGDPFSCLKWMDIPGIDSVWPTILHLNPDYMVASKVGGSVANQQERTRLLCETYTGSGWDLDFTDMKRIFDKLALNGVNILQFMGAYYTISDSRKGIPMCYPPSHNFQSALWQYYKSFSDYVTRIAQFLAESKSTAKVAVMYPTTSIFAENEGDTNDFFTNTFKPKIMEYIQNTLFAVTNGLLSIQVDFDYIFDEVLRDSMIEDGRIKYNNVQYELLILPYITTLTPENLRQLLKFIDSGGKVIFVNDIPDKDSEGNQLVELWDSKIGKYKVPNDEEIYKIGEITKFKSNINMITGGLADLFGRNLRDALFSIIDPKYHAIEIGRDFPGIYAVKRSYQGQDYIFLVNTVEQPEVLQIDSSYNVFNPETGENYLVKNTLNLDSYQSLLLTYDTGNVKALDDCNLINQISLKNEWNFSIESMNIFRPEYSMDVNGNKISLEIYKFPENAMPQLGETYTVSASFILSKGVGKIHLITEKYEKDVSIKVNGCLIENFREHRIWGENLAADISEFVIHGLNKISLTTSIPDWEAPHAMPFTVLGGYFSLEGNTIKPINKKVKSGDWSEQGYPYYSGAAVYSQNLFFDTVQDLRVYLNLSNVKNVAEVYLNGKRAGVRLWKPFKFEITPLIKDGINTLEIVVTNTSSNIFDEPKESGIFGDCTIEIFKS